MADFFFDAISENCVTFSALCRKFITLHCALIRNCPTAWSWNIRERSEYVLPHMAIECSGGSEYVLVVEYSRLIIYNYIYKGCSVVLTSIIVVLLISVAVLQISLAAMQLYLWTYLPVSPRQGRRKCSG